MKLNKVQLISLSSFLAGFSALASQIVINRFLTTFLGNTTTVQLSTLSVFMILLGLGALYAPKKKSYLLAALALLVGGNLCLGAVWTVYDILPPISIQGPVSFWAFIIVCTAPFALSYGIALAIFSKIVPSRKGIRDKFQKNYFVFHAGACLGLLLFDFYLLPHIGMINSLFLIALICTFSFLLLVREKIDERKIKSVKEGAYFKLFLFSLTFGINQFIIFRSHYYIYGPTPQNFTIMMAISVLGLSLAAFIARNWTIESLKYERLVPFALIAYIFYHYIYIDSVAHLLNIFGTNSEGGYVVMTMMYLPFYIMQGALLPYLHSKTGEESNKVIAVNSFGNVLGITLSTLIFINYFQPLYIILGSTFILSLLHVKTSKKAVLLLGLICIILAWSLDKKRYHYSFRYFTNTQKYKEMSSEILSIERYASLGAEFSIHHTRDAKRYLVIDGYKTISLDEKSRHTETEKLLGAYPAQLANKKEKALVLGLGSKATVKEIARSFEKVESVEINPAIFKYRRYNLFQSPIVKEQVPENIEMRFGDGFSYLMWTPEKFDLILNNVPTPQYSVASNIWTQDLAEMAKKKLKPGGIYSLWVNSNINVSALKILSKTVMNVFQHCYLGVISPRYASLTCSQVKKDITSLSPGVLFYLNKEDIDWFDQTRINKVNRPHLIYNMDYNLDSNWSHAESWDILRTYGVMKNISDKKCKKLEEAVAYLGKKVSLPKECLGLNNETNSH